MFRSIFIFVAILFLTSFSIYSIIVLKEKYFLKNNIVMLDKNIVSQEDIDETDINEFIFQGVKIKAGDRVNLVTSRGSFEGLVIGLKLSKECIHIINKFNKIEKIKITNIRDIKIINKYGSFF